MLSMLIKIIHLLVIILIVGIPFLNTHKYYIVKLGYIIIIPNIWIHWYLGSGLCILTVIDNYISGRDLHDGDGFVNRILEPIFLFTKNKPFIINILLWIITGLLWIKVIYDIFNAKETKELYFFIKKYLKNI